MILRIICTSCSGTKRKRPLTRKGQGSIHRWSESGARGWRWLRGLGRLSRLGSANIRQISWALAAQAGNSCSEVIADGNPNKTIHLQDDKSERPQWTRLRGQGVEIHAIHQTKRRSSNCLGRRSRRSVSGVEQNGCSHGRVLIQSEAWGGRA